MPVDKVTVDDIDVMFAMHVDERQSVLMTDTSPLYKRKFGFLMHNKVNHAVQYADGDIHVNMIEGFWQLLKRALSEAITTTRASGCRSILPRHRGSITTGRNPIRSECSSGSASLIRNVRQIVTRRPYQIASSDTSWIYRGVGGCLYSPLDSGT